MLVRDTEQILIERLKLFPGQHWVNDYFDLMAELISFTGLGNGDPRLVMSLPGGKKLPVTINHRYVLGIFGGARPTVGFLVEAGFEQIPEIRLKMTAAYTFKPLRGEGTLSTPLFVEFGGIPALPALKESWQQAVLMEVNRRKTSPYQPYHQPLIYDLAVNFKFRQSILAQAFPG